MVLGAPVCLQSGSLFHACLSGCFLCMVTQILFFPTMVHSKSIEITIKIKTNNEWSCQSRDVSVILAVTFALLSICEHLSQACMNTCLIMAARMVEMLCNWCAHLLFDLILIVISIKILWTIVWTKSDSVANYGIILLLRQYQHDHISLQFVIGPCISFWLWTWLGPPSV